MAFNPSPKVGDAARIAKKYGKNKVIILMLDDETIEYASYGKDGSMCDEAKEIANVAYDAVMQHMVDKI
jgi:hypothetical protein